MTGLTITLLVLVLLLLAAVIGISLRLLSASKQLHGIIDDPRWVAGVTPAGTATSCGICGNPPNPARTHDGRWRCPAHKGVA